MIGVRILNLQILKRGPAVAGLIMEIVVDGMVKYAPIRISWRSLSITQSRYGVTGVVIRQATIAFLQPPLRHASTLNSGKPLERMVKMSLRAVPIDEADRHFVARIAMRHPVLFSQAQILEEQLYGAESGFPHANCPDIRGFY